MITLGVIVAVSYGFYSLNNQFAEWLGTLFGTVIGAFLAFYLGVIQWERQRRRAEDERKAQLLTALASEVRASQNILSGTRSPINDSKNGTEYGRVVVVTLPSVVVEETARSALFTSERTDSLFKLAGHIQTHNAEVAFFQATRTGFATGEALKLATNEMKQRKDSLRSGFREWQQKIVAWRHETQKRS